MRYRIEAEPHDDPLDGAGAVGWVVVAIWILSLVLAFLIGRWTA